MPPSQDKTWAQQTFDRLVREHVAPLMKRHGYKKAGLNWRLRREDDPTGWGVVNIQKSSWGNRDEILFYVNLGVWWDDLPAPSDPRCGPSGPNESSCHIRARLGSLADDGQDLRWDIESDRLAHAGEGCLQPILKTLIPLLEERGLPWIERRLTARGIAAYRRKQAEGWVHTLHDRDLE